VHSNGERVDLIERALRQATSLVADEGGVSVGYVVLVYTFYGQWFVSMLCVVKAARRRDVGRPLIPEIETRCRTATLFTFTNESSGPTQALLRSP
jgi:GNAT superfamily N-acetyltransferase